MEVQQDECTIYRAIRTSKEKIFQRKYCQTVYACMYDTAFSLNKEILVHLGNVDEKNLMLDTELEIMQRGAKQLAK